MARTREATQTQRLIDRGQAEAIYGIPARTLYDFALRGAIPVVRFPGSRRIWFDRSDIEKLIEDSKQTAYPAQEISLIAP